MDDIGISNLGPTLGSDPESLDWMPMGLRKGSPAVYGVGIS